MALQSVSYVKLNESKLYNHLGLQMEEGYSFQYPPEVSRHYSYVEIPVRELYNTSEESITMKGLRNQYIRVVPACTVNPLHGYRFEVQPNPKLAEYGMIQPGYYLESESGKQIPYFHIWLRRDLELSDIDYAIRIFMRL